MGQDRKATHKRLDQLWNDNSVLELPIKNSKYVILSDLHMGDGKKADDFRQNAKVTVSALGYYLREGYKLILLGDVEEFWQFDLKDIRAQYANSAYRAMQAFAPNRILRLFGNHDSEWGALLDPATTEAYKSCPEAVKLVDANGKARVLLVHGHQGSTESDKNTWFSRFVVRVYRYVEPIIKLDKHTSATKSQIAGNYERIFHEWGAANNAVVVCGHSHRAIFASMSYTDRLKIKIRNMQREIQRHSGSKADRKALLKQLEELWTIYRVEEAKNRKISPAGSTKDPEPWYYNSGCALYTDGITSLEIENGNIRLVKWNRDATPAKQREILQPENGQPQPIVVG